MKRGIVLTICLLLICACPVPGYSTPKKEQYPSRAIDIIMPISAGAGADVMARVVAMYLAKELGQSVNVVNRPGGNSVPGVRSVLQANPDGYTLLGETQMFSSFQYLDKNLPYKVEDRTFICKVALTPMAMYCSATLPWKSLNDVEKAAKAKPDKFIWGGLGGQSSTDFVQLQFFSSAGIEISKLKKVVYQGAGDIMAAASGGHVNFGATGASGMPPFIQSGKLRGLAVTGDQRLKILPDVPSAKEAGYPDVTMAVWLGLSGPLGLPDTVVAKLQEVMKKITESKEFKDNLEKIVAIPLYVPSEQMKKEIVAEGKMAQKIQDTVGGK